jgi:hypothetical protein
MPSPLYNNATLAAQEAKRKLGIDVQPSETALAALQNEPSIDELLARAKDTLGRADSLEAERNQAAQWDTEAQQMAAHEPGAFEKGSVMESPTDTALRRLKTRGMPALDALAWAAGPELAVPYYAARGVSDLATRENPFSVGGAIDAAMMYPGLGALKRFGAAGRNIPAIVRSATDISHAAQPAQAIKDVIAGIAPGEAVRAEAGIPKGGFMKGSGYTQQKALESLKRAMQGSTVRGETNPAWKTFTGQIPAPSYMKDVSFQWPSDMGRNQEIVKAMARKGTFGPKMTEWVNRLDASGAHEIPLDIPSSEPMSLIDQLRARAQERFGRPFYQESPYVRPEPFVTSSSPTSSTLPSSWETFAEKPGYLEAELERVVNGLRKR